MTTDKMKAWLTEKLGREVTISQVRVNNVPCFLVDYINHSAPATKLASESEEGAISNLFYYLQSVKSPPDGSESVAATKEQI